MRDPRGLVNRRRHSSNAAARGGLGLSYLSPPLTEMWDPSDGGSLGLVFLVGFFVGVRAGLRHTFNEDVGGQRDAHPFVPLLW